MRLSQLGELGLLADLERRGLIVGVENDAAQLADGLVVTQDALVENVHFRLDWITLARPRLPRGGRQPERPRRVGRRAGGARWCLCRAGRDGARGRARAVRGNRGGGSPGRRRRHDRGAEVVMLERDGARPLGASPGPSGRAARATCSS